MITAFRHEAGVQEFQGEHLRRFVLDLISCERFFFERMNSTADSRIAKICSAWCIDPWSGLYTALICCT